MEQLATGTVTLCFEAGAPSNWNAKTRTYSDGANTVTVLGTAEVNLQFGVEPFSDAEQLQAAGAFLNSTHERIFEDRSKGLLA